MSLQNRIQEIAGCDLNFLDEYWDSSLLGFVERGNGKYKHKRACYGYQCMKAMLKDKHKTSEMMYHMIKANFTSFRISDCPLLLFRYNRTALWNIIRESKFPLLDTYLNKAIMGIGHLGWMQTGVVYNKFLCTDIVQQNQSTNNDNAILDSADATAYLEEHVIALDLGEKSPWFLTTVK